MSQGQAKTISKRDCVHLILSSALHLFEASGRWFSSDKGWALPARSIGLVNYFFYFLPLQMIQMSKILLPFPLCLLLLLCPRFRCTFGQSCRHLHLVIKPLSDLVLSSNKPKDTENEHISNKILASPFRLIPWCTESPYVTVCDLNIEWCFDININMHVRNVIRCLATAAVSGRQMSAGRKERSLLKRENANGSWTLTKVGTDSDN